jgi:integrase
MKRPSTEKSKKPRRARGEGSIQKITLRSGKTAYRGYLTVGYRPDGKPIRRTIQRPKKQEVVDALVQLRTRYKFSYDLDAEATMTLATLLTRWEQHFIATKAPSDSTIVTYRWAIGKIQPYATRLLVGRVAPLQLQGILNQYEGVYKTKSLKLIKTVLHEAFDQAVKWRICADNPAKYIDLPQGRKADRPDERRIVSLEDGTRLMRELLAERLGLAAALTYALGLRPGEAAALRGRDVDLSDPNAATVTIEQAHKVALDRSIKQGNTKTKRGNRRLPIPPLLVAAFQQQLIRRETERRMMIDKWAAFDPEKDLLFVRESDGGPIGTREVYLITRQVAERLGMGAVGPRILRRSILSTLAAQGVDAKVRAAIGGHTKEVTEEHYREVDSHEVQRAMEPLAKVFTMSAAYEEVSE